MNATLRWLGQRRKAVAALIGLAGELIAQAIPQTNPDNALLLHSVLAVITLWMVHASPNDQTPTLQEVVDDVIHGDAHVVAVPVPPPVPPTASGIG